MPTPWSLEVGSKPAMSMASKTREALAPDAPRREVAHDARARGASAGLGEDAGDDAADNEALSARGAGERAGAAHVEDAHRAQRAGQAPAQLRGGGRGDRAERERGDEDSEEEARRVEVDVISA